MKRLSTLIAIVLSLTTSCSNHSNDQQPHKEGTLSNYDISKTSGSEKRNVTLTPEELETDRNEHPEKYLVTDVVLDENVKPHRYNVVLINNSPYRLKRGVVQVKYDVFVGSSRLNTIQDEVEFLDVSSGDTSTVGSQDDRGHKSVYTPISHLVISTDFKIRKR
jgi:hypothetical protein